jgi:tight adherence protein C
MSPLTLSLLTFTSVILLFGGGVLLHTRRQTRLMQSRLASLNNNLGGGIVVGEVTAGPLEQFLVRLGTRKPKEKTKEEHEAAAEAADEPTTALRKKKRAGVQEVLVQAGYRRSNAFALFMGLRIALALVLLVLGLLISALVNPALMGTAFCLAMFGYIIPGFVLARIADQRRQFIRQTLPDTLDLLLLSVEAGLGLNAAMQRVAEERTANGPDPIGEELLQLSKELQVGMTRRDALRNLAERTGSDDVRSLSASLIQSERLGSSISQTLRAQAETIRTQRRLEAEELANKVQIKLLFPLILFIFPTVMIVVLFPAGLRLMEALGNLM